MSETKENYKGRAYITTANGHRTQRRVDITKIYGNKHRLTIHGVGEGEIQIHEGHFENEPWATTGRSGNTEIHRISGIAEQSGDQIKSRFKIYRDETETAEGDFDVKKSS